MPSWQNSLQRDGRSPHACHRYVRLRDGGVQSERFRSGTGPIRCTAAAIRRSVAQELCDAGLIFVNGAKAKASKEVKVGDTIEIKRRTRHTTVEVVNIPASKQVSKDAAGELYRMLADIPIDDDPTS